MPENIAPENVVVADAPENAEVVATPPKGRAALRAKLDARNAAAAQVFAAARPAVAVSSETPNQETVSAAVADLTQAGVEEKQLEKKPGETQARYETRIAQLILSNQRTEAESLKHKANFEKVLAERDELKARLAEASSDPVKALKLANMTPDELAQAMLDGKLTKAEEKVAKQELPPEVLELLEEAKRLKAEKVAQSEAAEVAKVRDGNIKIIETAKKSVADQFPVLELISNERLLDAYEQIAKATGEEPDFDEFAGQMQKNVVSEVAAAVSHKATFKALLVAKPELRAFLVEELGLKPAAAAVVAAEPAQITPRTLTNASAADNPTKGRPLSARERQALAVAAAENVFSQMKGK